MFEAVQIAYWLALSTWFGSVLFIAIAAPIVFRATRDADPTLPKVLSVNLEGQHSTLLAGMIMAELLEVLKRVQLACAGVLLVATIGHWAMVDRRGPELLLPVLRTALLLGAIALLIYDWRFVRPRIQKFRQEYLDHADEPDVANPALEQFSRYDQESVTVLRNILFLLLGLILFSSNIRPAPVALPSAGDTSINAN